MSNEVDILENDIRERFPEVLETLLCDRTTKKNIFWATDNYRRLGRDYKFMSPITSNLITGKKGDVITPRVKKSLSVQKARSKDMAEVFTPAWVCNAQNNLIDDAWFGRENAFNKEVRNDGVNGWEATKEKITFPEGKSWKDYVSDIRLEITCGEAPYVTSRYDATTGNIIPVGERIGILDRKLRVVNENCDAKDAWLAAVEDAYKSTYAYEWQGDSLLLAREAMLYAFLDNYAYKFGGEPELAYIQKIADIVSWNVWQMDGLKCVVPCSCKDVEEVSSDFFAGDKVTKIPCEGCAKENIKKHNGIYCKIKDWQENKVIQFESLVK